MRRQISPFPATGLRAESGYPLSKPGYNFGVFFMGMFPRRMRTLLEFASFGCRTLFDPNPALRAPTFRFASSPSEDSHGLPVVQWLLKRNCSITPFQLMCLYASLCTVSLGIATFFWIQGAKLVMPFAWAELLAVGAAFLIYARHARDGEKIMLRGGELVVELETAGRLQRASFNREWVRVEPQSGDGSLIEVSGQGQSVRVGRHLRPEFRPALAREIRFALRGC